MSGPKIIWAVGIPLILVNCPVFGGSYVRVGDEIDLGNIIPFAIVHPPGYDGQGGVLEIDICVMDTIPGSEKLTGPLQGAIETWNALQPTTGNCQGCLLFEEITPRSGALDAETVLLHELGHCAMGLGHVNLDWPPFPESSFTNSVGASDIIDGNGIRGDSEDVQGPAVQVHDMAWFRINDNNPVLIDSTVIDKNTFSCSVAAALPEGHNYAASANRAVAEALGFPNTQAVMYALADPEMQNRSLPADDVNMVRMAMTGADRVAGSGDDYTIRIRYRARCDDNETIRVELFPLPEKIVARCYCDIQVSFPQGLLKVHWTLIPEGGAIALQISLNVNRTWDFGDRIFRSGFENGDFSEWSAPAK